MGNVSPNWQAGRSLHAEDANNTARRAHASTLAFPNLAILRLLKQLSRLQLPALAIWL